MISRNKLKSYIEIARIDKPIGIYLLLWPSVLGLLLAGTINEIKIIDLLIVIIGSILVRSCGCVINDISDYKFRLEYVGGGENSTGGSLFPKTNSNETDEDEEISVPSLSLIPAIISIGLIARYRRQ